jgi:hypothetical protein
MLDSDQRAVLERSAVSGEETHATKRIKETERMHKLIMTQTGKEKHVDGVVPSPNAAPVHVPAPRRKHECRACAVSLAAEDAVIHPTTWMQKLGVERKPAPGRIFVSCFPLVGELLDKESPYIDPALFEAKVRATKPATNRYRRQSTGRKMVTNRATLIGQGGLGRQRTLGLVHD